MREFVRAAMMFAVLVQRALGEMGFWIEEVRQDVCNVQSDIVALQREAHKMRTEVDKLRAEVAQMKKKARFQELVAQEAQAVLRRRNSAGFLEEAVHDCNQGDATAAKFLKLDRRREVLALNVEYYMVQAGVIRPSVIVKKVCDSRVTSLRCEAPC